MPRKPTASIPTEIVILREHMDSDLTVIESHLEESCASFDTDDSFSRWHETRDQSPRLPRRPSRNAPMATALRCLSPRMPIRSLDDDSQ